MDRRNKRSRILEANSLIISYSGNISSPLFSLSSFNSMRGNRTTAAGSFADVLFFALFPLERACDYTDFYVRPDSGRVLSCFALLRICYMKAAALK